MDESDAIISAVQAFVEMVQAEFTAAAASMLQGTWHGLDADARARVSRKAREEAKRLTAVLDRVQAGIDAAPGCALSGADVARRLEMERARAAALEAAAGRLTAALAAAQGGAS